MQKLQEQGYEVRHGLTRAYADSVRELVTQPSICVYCLKDSTSRFCDQDATAQWLQKGRAVFLLVETETGNVAGYGWSGPETSSHVPGGKVTVAMRISEEYQGRGLATPYLQAIIGATQSIYDATDFWLETWASNAGAVHVYGKVGFAEIEQEQGDRALKDGGSTPDTRLYMRL
jgi:ribosomal protein S18 acetylase RimI-like enzyme